MQQNRQLIVAAAAGYKTRTETFNDREYLVVPVVALVEGVVHAMNAGSPEFVAAEEFSRAPQGWNGRPLFYGHPMNGDSPVSGNSPDVLEEKAIGLVFNTRLKSKKLSMEAWIDVEKAKEVAPDLIDRVNKGDAIEISVGVFVETDDTEGIFEGKKYLGAWHDIVPDHLALLPKGDEGACSVEMGCGVRAAKGAHVDHMYAEWLETGPETCELLKTLRNIPSKERDKMPAADFAGPNQSFPIAIPGDVHDAAQSIGRAKGNRDAIKKKIISIAYRKGADFVAQLPEDWKKKKDQKNMLSKFLSMFRVAQPANEMSNTDLTRKLYEALRAKGIGNMMNVEAFVPVTDPNRVVYSCYEPAMEVGMGYPYTVYVMYERAFTLDANGVVTIGDSEIEVEPVLSYEPVLMAEEIITEGEPTAAKGARNSKADQQKIQMMHDHAVALGAYCDPKMASAPKTASGAQCSGGGNAPTTTQKETDMKREELVTFLQTATEDQLKALSVAAGEKPAEQPAAVAQPAATPAAVAQPAAEKEPSLEDLMAKASPDVQAQFKASQTAATVRKAASIKALKDTGRCTMTDEVLGAKSQEELDQMLALTGVAPAKGIDFGGLGAPKDMTGNKTEVAPPPDMNARILASRKKA